MSFQVRLTCSFLYFSVLVYKVAPLSMHKTCKFKNSEGECVTVTEKTKPENEDIYCRDYFEINAKPVVPLTLKEGKRPALPMEFPHMVAIGIPNNRNVTSWSCGGILISKQHVLTSGTCLQNEYTGEAKYVRSGDLNVRSEESGPYRQDFEIRQFFIHPDYKTPSYYHNVGIAQLDRAVEINPFTIPSCLNTKAESPSGELYSATGWGVVNQGGLNPTLQKVVLNIVENEDCRRKYNDIIDKKLPNGIDNNIFICAGAPNTETCQGDSGGPLQQITSNGFAVVHGIISFGAPRCELEDLPSIYVRVSTYIDWIKSVIE